MTTDVKDKPIIAYIMGTTYCGSTLLNTLLNRHSQIFGLNELTQLGRYIREGDPQHDPLRLSFWRDVSACYGAEAGEELAQIDLLRGWNSFRHTLSAKEFEHWLHINELLYDCIGSVARAPVLVEASKHPRRLVMLQSTQVAERIRVIHLIRDGRGYINSALNREHGFYKRLGNWGVIGLQAVSLQRKYPRWLRVRYEDLAADTETTLKRICDFVGVEFETEILQYRAADYVGVGDKGKRMAENQNLAIGLDETWRVELSTKHKVLFAVLGGWLNKYYGY